MLSFKISKCLCPHVYLVNAIILKPECYVKSSTIVKINIDIFRNNDNALKIIESFSFIITMYLILLRVVPQQQNQ